MPAAGWFWRLSQRFAFFQMPQTGDARKKLFFAIRWMLALNAAAFAGLMIALLGGFSLQTFLPCALVLLANATVAWMLLSLSKAREDRIRRQLTGLAAIAQDIAAGRYDRPIEADDEQTAESLTRALETMRAAVGKRVQEVESIAAERDIQLTVVKAELARQERLLIAVNDKFVESEKMKALLNRTLVHDIKNIAFSMAGDLQFLRKGVQENAKNAHKIEKLSTSCSEIFRLTNNILDISRVEEGKLIIHREILDGSAIYALAKKSVETSGIGERGVTANVAPPPPKFAIYADRSFLERIFQNLLSNATRHGEKNGRINISFHQIRNERQVRFFSSGTPIPDELRTIIFDKFAHARAGATQHSHGLGLLFCRMLMQEHGGRIWLRAAPDGNCFWLGFPSITERMNTPEGVHLPAFESNGSKV